MLAWACVHGQATSTSGASSRLVEVHIGFCFVGQEGWAWPYICKLSWHQCLCTLKRALGHVAVMTALFTAQITNDDSVVALGAPCYAALVVL